MVVAALIGLYLGAKHDSHSEQLSNAAASGNLDSYHRLFEVYKWRSSVHAHGMLFSLSSIGVGLVLSRQRAVDAFPFSEVLIGALIFSTVVWTGAALRRIRPLMALSDLIFVAAMVFTAICVAVF